MPTQIFYLTKPVEAHGQEVKQLELRELTTSDIIKHGYPFTIYSDGEGHADTRIQPGVIVSYAVDIASVPRSTIRSLCIEDFMNLQEVIMNFFGSTGTDKQDSSKRGMALTESND